MVEDPFRYVAEDARGLHDGAPAEGRLLCTESVPL